MKHYLVNISHHQTTETKIHNTKTGFICRSLTSLRTCIYDYVNGLNNSFDFNRNQGYYKCVCEILEFSDEAHTDYSKQQKKIMNILVASKCDKGKEFIISPYIDAIIERTL